MAKAMIPAAHRLMLLCVALLVLRSSAAAHQLDEFLQATLVEIDPDQIRLHIHFTPGVEVAQRVVGMIDTDGDGVITSDEANAYSELLKLELIARLDERRLELKLVSSSFPSPADLREGWERIELEYAIAAGGLSPGMHRFVLENRHLPGVSAYLVNATKPRSASIQIASQQRSPSQSITQIEFNLMPGNAAAPLQKNPRSTGALVLIAIALLAAAMGGGLMRKRLR